MRRREVAARLLRDAADEVELLAPTLDGTVSFEWSCPPVQLPPNPGDTHASFAPGTMITITVTFPRRP